MECETSTSTSTSTSTPNNFHRLMAQRKHIEFERADMNNDLVKLEYFYTNHKEFCEYHMEFTAGIFEWTNYRAFLKTKEE